MSEAPVASVAAAGPRDYERILVIRLGALGDFVLSLGPMAAIRRFHPKARIVLLTTSPYAALARAAPYADEVWIDERAPWWRPLAGWSLTRRLRRVAFQRVYDLQTSGRTARYWQALGRPEWSGHVAGSSHPHADAARDALHTVERQKAQLKIAGIDDVPAADLSWAKSDLERFALKQPFVLFVPGGSAHRPAKRWPAEKYMALARTFARTGVTPVFIGASAEAPVLTEIARQVPDGVNLCGKTSFADIAALARVSLGAIGNDTGPMHLAAAAGAPSLVLFSSESNPDLCAPRPGAQGTKVNVLRKRDLVALSVSEVQSALPFAVTKKR